MSEQVKAIAIGLAIIVVVALCAEFSTVFVLVTIITTCALIFVLMCWGLGKLALYWYRLK